MKTSPMTGQVFWHAFLAGYNTTMYIDSQLTKKDILSDPVTVFFADQSTPAPETKARLQKLSQQYNQLAEKIKAKQTKSKKLSRQIGAAKRNNDNTDTLLLLMRETSEALKQQTKNLHTIEEDILLFFKIDEDHQKIAIEKTHHPDVDTHPHIAKDNKLDPKNILIKPLIDEYSAWDAYVDNHPTGCIHHRSQWISLFKESYGHECHYLFASDESNAIVGILPLIRLKSRLFGDMFISMPFFQHAGVIADHPIVEQKLINSANLRAQKLGIKHIEYRDEVERDDMPVQKHKVNMVLSLSASSDELWNTFSSKLRAQIRRPQRENTSVICGHKELLDDFYSVYARNMRDLGSPPHSKKFIRNILDQFPDNSWLFIIQLDDKPVAASFLLGHKSTLEVPLASTIRDVNSLSINMLLYWEILQFAINKKYKTFNFGRSTINTGTYNFKKQWGAKPKQLYWHYWLASNTDIPGINPSNPKYKLIIGIWKRLPVAITLLIGPWLVKNIP